MNPDIQRIHNDKIYGPEWAKDVAASMPLERMLDYIYTPNSTYLAEAMRERLKTVLTEAGVIKS